LEKPKRNDVEFLHPLDVMQWSSGTFVSEEGNARSYGWSSLRYGMAHSDRPISLAASVCRGKNVREPLTIERRLLLPEQELRLSSATWTDQRNAPCRFIDDDPLEAERLPWPDRPYEATFVVSVSDRSGKTVAKASRTIWIIGPSR
jgi:hypothetical protein